MKLSDALAAAADAEVRIYPIGVATDAAATQALSRMARETGGSYSSASSSSALSSVYGAISEKLGSTYTIAYESDRPGRHQHRAGRERARLHPGTARR